MRHFLSIATFVVAFVALVVAVYHAIVTITRMITEKEKGEEE